MMADGSPSAMQRTFQTLGTWDYTRAIQPSHQLPQTTTSITDPAGNLTTLLFSGIYETDRKVYTGSSSLLDHSYICYVNGESHSLCSTASVTTQPITFRGVIDFPNDNGSYYSELDTFYDGTYGFVTSSKAWDFGNGSSHNFLQQTSITYNSSLCSSKNICDHPASVQVLDGGGTQKALTNYSYDGNGNTTEVYRWAHDSYYLKTYYSPNSNGTVHTVTDTNGTVATYTYNSGVCNAAFPTSVSVPSSWTGGNLTTSYTYNCNGGMVTGITDPNNLSISIGYTRDPYFWRPDKTVDQLGNTTYYNYYAWQNYVPYSYITAVGQVEAVMAWNSSQGNSTIDQLSTPEAFGRPWLQQTLDADNGGWDTIETANDSVGHTYWVTSPYISTAGHDGGSQPAEYWLYDGLSRVVDEKNFYSNIDVHYTYNFNDVEVTVNPAPSYPGSTEHAKSRQMEYDVLGRVTSVCELLPSGGGSACSGQKNNLGNAYFTTYQYDPMGDLTSVTQTGQSRTFMYDGLSRVVNAINPETTKRVAAARPITIMMPTRLAAQAGQQQEISCDASIPRATSPAMVGTASTGSPRSPIPAARTRQIRLARPTSMILHCPLAAAARA